MKLRLCNTGEKFMLKNLLIAIAVVGAPALAAGAALESQPAPRIAAPDSAKVRVAQSCWYAIMACSTSRGEASAWTRRHGVGRVINTSSDEFPGFTPGYYCVVEGPMGQGRAQATARSYRGISPTSYAKSGC
jgi:hypothetical protein